MSLTHSGRVRRFLTRPLAAFAALLILGTLGFLPFAGRYLVAEDPLERSEVIFVLAGTRAERWLESVDLYREGWAPHVVLSNGRPEAAEVPLLKLGVRLPTDPELGREAMTTTLGIPRDVVTLLPGSVDNTAQEASALRATAPPGGWHSIIVITSKYHTRRAGFAFRREFGSTARITMRGSRYDAATPRRWWSDRADIRYVASELPKLLLYRLGLGG